MIDDIIRNIDLEISNNKPPIDDYDAGIVEGLRIARHHIVRIERDNWRELMLNPRSEYETQDGGNF